MKIAIAGAPSSGKSPLAAALGHALQMSGRQAEVTVATPPFAPDLARHDLVLLTGLEAAPRAAAAQLDADQAIRAAFASAGIPYRVMYGTADQRLAQALDAVNPPLPDLRRASAARRGGKGAWTWVCDKCSDPVCEHRLLSDLLAQRNSAAA
ncbi:MULTISPECIES: hypothetical protein [unclassified Polaromonas]|uniref:hypothetical protein n=1 Tax=unclassified Polaromonas TaxID=2638319 RepID=UPI000F09350E|nr:MULTISPECIES: hypothetical protein [unclassified Polaromonas]AYQ29059.1 hypothetical protein DT070_14135 [Polaromonas sp. SP1]QGJ19823.1 hypothetical protein F7R28_16470 [Polaromonas sp. Pch-P]